MQINPVTKIASEYQEIYRQSIAVNDEFITYGLKQGHIRVLHRYSEARALLKGHTAPIASICFLRHDVIAAGGTNGQVHAWKVKATEDENALDVEKILGAGFSPGCDSSAVLVVPCSRRGDGKQGKVGMVIGIGNSVISLDVDADGKGEDGQSEELLDMDPLDPSPYGERMTAFPMQDAPLCLAVCRNSGVLAVGSKRGRVYLAPIEREDDGVRVGKLMETVDIKEEVTSVNWVQEGMLLVSTENGRRQKIYVNESGMNLEEDISISSAEKTSFIHTMSLWNDGIVLLADTPNNCIYSLHINMKRRKFDYLAKFSVGKPVLSMFVFWNSENVDEGRGGIEVNAVQTDAVQQYYIDVDMCMPEEDAVDHTVEEMAVAVQDSEVANTAQEGEVDGEDEEEAEEGEDKFEKNGEESVHELPKLHVSDEHMMDHGHSKLLTPSDIISSVRELEIDEGQKEEAPIKILKRPSSTDVQVSSETENRAADTAEEECMDAGPKVMEEVANQEDSSSPEVEPVALSLLTGSSADIFMLLKREIDRSATQQAKLVEKSVKLLRQHMDDQVNKLNKNLEKKIGTQVKNEIKSMQSQITSSVQNATRESIRTILPKEALGAIKTALDKQLAQAVQGALNKTIQDSFKTSFSKQIIPAFEGACQSMLRQLDNTVSLGIQEHSNASRLALKEPMELVNSLQTALHAVRSLSDGVSIEHHRSSSLGSIRSPKAHDYKAEIKGLIGRGEYEAAFSKALGLQDLSLVSWLCSNVDAPSVLSCTPPALSQMVLLSLLQQLGADLASNTSNKISWIREVAMCINPADHSIAAHIKLVLEQVHESLQGILPTLQGSEASSCKLAMHVVRSQMSS